MMMQQDVGQKMRNSAEEFRELLRERRRLVVEIARLDRQIDALRREHTRPEASGRSA